MKKVPLEIVGLSYSNSSTDSYVLVLGEEYGDRRLPIIIGSAEAQAIAIELEGMAPSRPLTHDLFKTFASSFSILVEEVEIYSFEAGVFYSKLRCKQGENSVSIDARTSDAIALAVRFKCSLFTTESIMNEAGVMLEQEIFPEADSEATGLDDSETENKQDEIKTASVNELEKLLSKAIENEDYEYASQLRDELNSRGST